MEKTAARTRISLNNLWQIQPADKKSAKPGDTWYWVKVPGNWKHGQNVVRSSDAKKPVRWGIALQFEKAEAVWLRREFTLPAGMAKPNMKAILCFPDLATMEESASVIDTVLLNGKKASGTERTYDITNRLLRDKTNELLVKISPAGRGMVSAIELRLAPADVVLDDIWIIPTVKRKAKDVNRIANRVTLANHRQEAAEFMVEAEIIDRTAGDKLALRLPSRTVRMKKGRNAKVELSAEWPTPRMWSPDDPYLYYMRTRVKLGGEILDERDTRFGFREFYVQGGDVYLNGKKAKLRGWWKFGASYDATWRQSGRSVYREALENYKAAGFNMVWTHFRGHTHTKTRSMRALVSSLGDELGLMIHFTMRGLKFDLKRDGKPVGDTEKNMEKEAKLLRNHPSVVLMDTYHYGGLNRLYKHPLYLDDVNMHCDVRHYQNTADAARRLVRKYMHPSMPTVWFHGIAPDIANGINYYTFTLPLQEAEGWLYHWKDHKKKPVMYGEFRPFFLWDTIHMISSNGGYFFWTELMATENTARYIGNESYGMSDKMYDNWMKIRKNTGWGNPPGNRPAADKVAALFSRNLNRSLRTHDCSILCYAGSVGVDLDAYLSAGKFVANPVGDTQADLTAWEGHTDKIWSFDNDYGKLNAATKAHIDTFQPLLVYLGGPPRDETAKDHIYWVGEEVAKGIVAINDHQRDIAFSVDWTFKNAAGAIIEKGTKEFNVGPGMVHTEPVKLTIPNASGRQDYTVSIRAKADGKEMGRCGEDTFALTAFEKGPAPKLDGVVLVDKPGGRSTRMFQEAGIEVKTVADVRSAARGKVILIGREAFDKDCDGGTLAKLIRQGATAVVFEQKRISFAGRTRVAFKQEDESILGLQLTRRRQRYTFIRTPGHPVLAGLTKSDFIDWRGASDIIEAYPDPLKDKRNDRMQHFNSYPEEWYNWGNRGIVATYVLSKKPDYGSYRVLLDCGFDQKDSPLVEFFDGRGRLILCQLDVTSRYGKDPVATKLVNNLLKYAATPAPAPVRVAYVGGTAGRALLDDMKIGARTLRGNANLARYDVVIGGEDIPAPIAAMIQDYVKEGGVFFSLKRSADELRKAPWLPEGTEVREEFVWRSTFKTHEDLVSGLGMSDFYWKIKYKIPVVSKLPAGSFVTEPGVLARVKLGKGSLIICQVNPVELKHKFGGGVWDQAEYLKDPFVYHAKHRVMFATENHVQAKATRILAMLLTNIGVRSGEQLGLAMPEVLPLSTRLEWEHEPRAKGKWVVEVGEISNEKWFFKLDPRDTGIKEKWFAPTLDENAGVHASSPERQRFSEWSSSIQMNPPWAAIDGLDMSTWASCGKDKRDSILDIDFGAAAEFDKISIIMSPGPTEYKKLSFMLQVPGDAEGTWRVIAGSKDAATEGNDYSWNVFGAVDKAKTKMQISTVTVGRSLVTCSLQKPVRSKKLRLIIARTAKTIHVDELSVFQDGKNLIRKIGTAWVGNWPVPDLEGWEHRGCIGFNPSYPASHKTGKSRAMTGKRDAGSGGNYDGIGWYRVRVRIPESWKGRDAYLHIPSVSDYETSYFNGRVIGKTDRKDVDPMRWFNQVRNYRIPPDLINYGGDNVIAIRVVDDPGMGLQGGSAGGVTGRYPVRLIADPHPLFRQVKDISSYNPDRYHHW